MFGIRVFIWLSRHIHSCIAYEIDTSKIIATFIRICYCLHNLIRLNSIVCHIQTTRCTILLVFADRFRYLLTMFGIRVLIGLSRLLHAHIAYEIDTAKIIAAFSRISYCLLDFIRLNSIICHVQTTRCTMMRVSLFDCIIN